MRRFAFMDPLFMSFYSRDIYQDVALQWKGLCLTYLLALVALCEIPAVLRTHTGFADYLRAEAPKLVSQFPVVTIRDGKVSVNIQEPYYIRDEETGKPFMIIDTTGHVTTLEGTEAMALLTKSALLVRQKKDGAKSIDLSGVDNLVADRSLLYKWLDVLEDYFGVILYPFVVLFSFLFHFAEVVCFGGLGLVMIRSSSLPKDLRLTGRIAAVALTPGILAGALFDLLGAGPPFWWVIRALITLVYFRFGLNAASSSLSAGAGNRTDA